MGGMESTDTPLPGSTYLSILESFLPLPFGSYFAKTELLMWSHRLCFPPLSSTAGVFLCY